MSFNKFVKTSVIFLIIFAWVFSGLFQIWQNPPIPPEIEKAKASPAVANLILLWDPAVGATPTDWTCISCSAGQDFYQRFIRGNSSYGVTQGGTATHTHTDPGTLTLNATGAAATGAVGSTAQPRPPLNTHTHDVTAPSIASGLTANNLPAYRTFRVIRYNYGVPDTLPTGVIAFFDAAPPSGWTAVYNDAATPRYPRGDNTVTTGGSNTHQHSLTIKTSSAAAAGSDKSGAAVSVAPTGHTHAFNAQNTAAGSSEPPYINVALGQLNATSTITTNMIAMFDNTPPAGQWSVQSNNGGAFFQRFPRPTNASLGESSDTSTHTHTATTFTSNACTESESLMASGSTHSATTHTHTVSISLDAQSQVPLYWDAIFAKASSTPTPNLEQIHYHWRNDDNNEADATSATGGTEDTVYSSFPASQNKRLRIEISNEGGAAGQDVEFRLDYKLKGAGCGTGTWTDVGATPSDDWDMYDTANFPTDGADTTNIATSTGGVTDANPTWKTPNYGVKDTSSKVATTTLTYEDFIEMEFSIKPNVTSGTYCFRVSNDGDTTNFTYTRYAEATVAVAYTVGCNASTSTTDFGTLTTIAISTSTPDVIITASTTYPGGFVLYVKDSNAGLYSATATHLVTSTTALLEIGTAGYGIQATTTAAEITINPIYLKTGNDVGGLETSNVVLASSTGPFPEREVKVKHKAAISDLTKAASDYTDTITFSCSGNE